MGLIEDRNKRGGEASVKVKTTYGITNYYRFYKQRGGALEKSAFSRIMKSANKILIEELIENAEEYRLPENLGKIAFRKRKNEAFMTSKGIRSNSAVNWKKTMELWENDPRAHEARIKIKYSNMHTSRYMFKIKVFERRFKNRQYFKMDIKRSAKRAFAQRIKTYNKPKIDAYISINN